MQNTKTFKTLSRTVISAGNTIVAVGIKPDVMFIDVMAIANLVIEEMISQLDVLPTDTNLNKKLDQNLRSRIKHLVH
ncbi:Hypothetical predicted protein [Octopus vulgaris]|uniref:Uncharacterized protein n=1 Tax=Octopus vulgaris TaxID=6645 RepID=A0AA36FAX1_OCTVU|nr:Hypothetical predicted protein [Octopus vulgaris]